MRESDVIEFERRQGLHKRREFWHAFRSEAIEVIAVLVLVGGLLALLNWGG